MRGNNSLEVAGVAFRLHTHYAGDVIDFKTETVLSLAGAAKRLGVTVKTVRSWSKRVRPKRLETAKLEAIQRFSEQREDAPSASTARAVRRNHQQTSRLLWDEFGSPSKKARRGK